MVVYMYTGSLSPCPYAFACIGRHGLHTQVYARAYHLLINLGPELGWLKIRGSKLALMQSTNTKNLQILAEDLHLTAFINVLKSLILIWSK